MLYNCDTCGKEFELSKKQQYNKDATKYYCSKNCVYLPRTNNLIGKKFGKLVVLSKSDQKNKWNHLSWLCICECGAEKTATTTQLLGGDVKSCGCLKVSTNRVHGMSGTRVYYIWVAMKQRCNNFDSAAYGKYGGRGITVCTEWNKFDNFYRWATLTGYADNLTIERIDNNLGYSPSNCRWATRKEQLNNNSRSRKIMYKGKTQTMAQWAEELGLSYSTFKGRVSANLPDEKLFFPGRLIEIKNSRNNQNKRDRLDHIWTGIKSRCSCQTNPLYKDYGGRGITVCFEWQDRQVFKDWALTNGYEETLSIDRRDNDGNYSPENCRWVTNKEQQNNKRNNRLLEYNGETMNLSQWAARLGINSMTLSYRVKKLKTEDEIFHAGRIDNKCRPKRNNRMLEYNGEVMSLVQWAVKLGITPETLSGRLKHIQAKDRVFYPGRLR